MEPSPGRCPAPYLEDLNAPRGQPQRQGGFHLPLVLGGEK